MRNFKLKGMNFTTVTKRTTVKILSDDHLIYRERFGTAWVEKGGLGPIENQ